ncbi:MAG: hypothetical protein K6E10_00650 [Eubacterium sp.]|nr:hypothetical protein [Eubacterium sp.]
MDDKNKIKLITRVLVAAYIIYLGFMILKNAATSENQILFTIIGIVFFIVGGGFIVYSIYSFKKNNQEENNK